MIPHLLQLARPELDPNIHENFNFWHLSSTEWWTTGSSDQISRHVCIYVAYSGRGGHTEHTSVEIDKISRLDLLIISLSDSVNLENLNFWHISSGAWWMTGNCNLISRRKWIYVTYSGRGDQTAHTNGWVVKTPHLQQSVGRELDFKSLESLNFWHLSIAEWWMTGNSDQTSRHICIHVIHSGRGDQTGHTSVKIDKISRLE